MSTRNHEHAMAGYQTMPGGRLSQAGHAVLRWCDAAASRVAQTTDPFPVSTRFGRHHLWHVVPRQSERVPPGPPRLALTFDLDYQADTDALDQLVKVVAEVGATMSIAAVGALVDADPDPYGRALSAGHELVNHSMTHPDNPVLNPHEEFWHLSSARMIEEIGGAQEVFARRLGQRPRGFRTPHFKDAPRLLEAVETLGEFEYLSSTLAADTPMRVPYFPMYGGADPGLRYESADPSKNSRLMMLPLTPCPGLRWSPFCSYVAIRQPANPAAGAGLLDLDQFASRWLHMLAAARPDAYACVYFDPMDVMRDEATIAVFTGMLQAAVQRGWQLSSLGEVEQAWRNVRVAP